MAAGTEYARLQQITVDETRLGGCDPGGAVPSSRFTVREGQEVDVRVLALAGHSTSYELHASFESLGVQVADRDLPLLTSARVCEVVADGSGAENLNSNIAHGLLMRILFLCQRVVSVP